MSGFTVPFSSSPPATPDSHRNGRGFGSFASNPSTTPAGPPPPSSAGSFTPAGPPPNTSFGSSQLDLAKSPFPTQPFNKNRSFTVPSSSLMSNPHDETSADKQDGDHESENGQWDLQKDEEHHAKRRLDETERSIGWAKDRSEDLTRSMDFDWAGSDSLMRSSGGQGAERSRGNGQSYARAVSKRKNSPFPVIAKDFAKTLGPAKLVEPDDLVLETDNQLLKLYAGQDDPDNFDKIQQAALIAVPEALGRLWQSCCNRTKRPTPQGSYTIGIGPNEDEPGLNKATFLSSLLLRLHHPPAARGSQAFATSYRKRSYHVSNSIAVQERPKPYPEALLEWLQLNHDPYHTLIAQLRSTYPNVTKHADFWDTVLSTTVRGKLHEVISLLKDADFRHALTAIEDGQGEIGYKGGVLGVVTRVVDKAIQLLNSCPAVQDGDWDVTGADWTIFRKRIEHAINELAIIAEGRDRDLEPVDSGFEAENFGMRSTDKSLSQSARKAESRVPWTIYQNLKALYGILLGGATEIISFARDWVEATVALTVWWDGDDDDEVAVGSLALNRRSLRKLPSRVSKSVEVNAGEAYRRRLAYAFGRVTDDSDEDAFQINSNNAVEVGLASVFEGNVEGVLQLLRSWSMPLAAAVIEIADEAAWLECTDTGGMINGFDESDLMVLSYGQPEKCLSRDSVFIEYVQMLFDKPEFWEKDQVLKEGWEVAMQVLNRFNDVLLARKKARELLRQLPLDNDERVDKIIKTCQGFTLDQEAHIVAEEYADSIAENSDQYGNALVYYARGRSLKKVKDVLDLLVSLSLVQSAAYPPLDHLDSNLRALIFGPQEDLEYLVDFDADAARLLQTYLSGYATVRRFYDLRDEEFHLEEGRMPMLRPIARKVEAATALMTVIASSANSIDGGLYDANTETVIQIDGLLTLLGEAMVFVDQPRPFLPLRQILALLKIIEDLEAVTPKVFARCEECLQSALTAARASQQAPNPQELLKKSISSLTSSSGFSLVGSSMLEEKSARSNKTGKSFGRGVAQEDTIQRGWDWRVGLPTGGTGREIIRILRLGLAKDVARAWIDGE